MKRSFSIFLFSAALSFFLFAQMNQLKAQSLQFKQVLLINSPSTVPADHVWKIESCLGQRSESAGGSSMQTAPSQHQILVDGTAISVATNGYGSISAYGSSSSYWHGTKTEVCTTMPIWLPAGTPLDKSTNVSFISVVEFEVVP
ncbi:MAG: hypothetical protein IT223_02840 [Crocinitomicaceae bacterium]|nr:hypothetical protein [Crocinitomicaceae bacterium]